MTITKYAYINTLLISMTLVLKAFTFIGTEPNLSVNKVLLNEADRHDKSPQKQEIIILKSSCLSTS